MNRTQLFESLFSNQIIRRTVLAVVCINVFAMMPDPVGAQEKTVGKEQPQIAKRVEELRVKLRSKNREECEAAANELIEFGSDAAAAAPELLKLALNDDSSPNAKVAALSAISVLGPAAYPVYIRILKSGRQTERERMANLIGSVYQPGHAEFDAAICEALRDRHNLMYYRISWQLQTIPPIKEALPILLEYFRDEDPKFNSNSNIIEALKRYGDQAAEALPELDRRSRNAKDRERQTQAIGAMGKIGHKSDLVARRLHEIMTDRKQSLYVRGYAASALAHSQHGQQFMDSYMKIVAEGGGSKRQLTKDEQEKEYALKGAALEAAAANLPGKENVGLILQMFIAEREGSLMKASAAKALGRIGPHARAAAPALLRAMTDDEIMPDFFDEKYLQAILNILGTKEGTQAIENAAAQLDRSRGRQILNALESLTRTTPVIPE